MKRILAFVLCAVIFASLGSAAFATDAVKYTVTYQSDGATITSVEVYSDDPVIALQRMSDETRCFEGWYDGDTKAGTSGSSYTVTGTVTLTAHWANSHSFTDIETITPATCTAAGSKSVKCTVCGYETTATIQAHHTLVYVDRQEPTCDVDGHVAHYKCSVESCGQCFEDDQGTRPLGTVVLPHGHVWQDVARVEPTCGAAGTEAHKKCERCNITDPAEPAAIPATGQHTWTNTVAEQYLKRAATCSDPAEYYKSCSVCGAKSTNEYFTSGEATGQHNFVNNVCTVCGAKRASVIVVIRGSGSGTLNGNPIVSGDRVILQNGQTVSMNFVPAQGWELTDILENGQARTNITMPYQYTAVEGLLDFTVTAVFTEVQTNTGTEQTKTVSEPTKTVVTDPVIRSAAAAKLTEIANARGSRTDLIQWEVFDVQPVWSDGTQMTPEDARQNGPITFTLPPPVAGMTSENYRFMAYHYVNGEFVYLADSLTVSSSDFSPYASFAIPKVIPASSSASSASSTVLVTGKTTPAAPKVQAAPIIDDGKTQTGAILDVDSTMEYMRKDSSEGYKPIAVSQLNDLAAGTYYVRYKETTTTNPSPATAVVVEEYYTVTLKHLYGRGTYSTDADKYPDLSDTYLVKKGGEITVKFIPDSHWWLYVINVNDKYVGQANVKTNFTLKDIKTKTELSYGFSDSSSSPKTGDESEILKWFAAEVISLMGMVSITYYLFRKKEY